MITFKKYLIEIIKHSKMDDLFHSFTEKNDDDYLPHESDENSNSILGYVDKVHYHPKIKPSNLSDKEKKIINGYTFNDSVIYNKILDTLHDESKKRINIKNNLDAVDNIKKINDSFTQENTNKAPIITYSGVPQHIGRKFTKSQSNVKFTLPRFTSTSTDFFVANNFAQRMSKRAKDIHLLKIYNEPNATMSIAHHSDFPHENEMILPHGTHITYHYTTQKTMLDMRNIKNADKVTLHIHHVTAHNTKTPLEQYSGYKNLLKT